MTIKTVHFIFLMVLILSACTPLQSAKPPPSIYRLQTPEKNKACPGSLPVVSVSRPEMPAGFDTDRIAVYLDGGKRLDYAADARWASSPDEMIEALIVGFLRQSCSGMAVQGSHVDTTPAYRLAVKIHDFEPVYSKTAQDAPQLRVSAAFTLIRLPGDRAVADFTLSKSRQAQQNSLTDITAGLEDLLREILSDAQSRLKSGVHREP